MTASKKASASVGVIGGSGLYKMGIISRVREVRVKTPFGPPSDSVFLGKVRGVPCAFLPRHGRRHTILPTELNSRANIWALKSLGVERVVSFGAVGSLKEELPPRHFVFPDQMVDETRHRRSTFFGDGIVAHVAFAHPFCDALGDALFAEAERLGIPSSRGGVFACMEGPQFSTKAESDMHRFLGYSIIGMTVAGEAKLAREAELCYASVAMITDYDCWKEGEEVSLEQVVANLSANGANAERLIDAVVSKIVAMPRSCPCARALKDSIVTSPAAASKKTLDKLKLIAGPYVRS